MNNYQSVLDDMFSKLKSQHDFILSPIDTDSISFCKSDQTPFSEEEQNALLEEINSMMPGYLRYAHDGYFPSVLVLKSKNYVLWDGKKLKIKGSALRSSKVEPAIKEFIGKIIDVMLFGNYETELLPLYNSYIHEVYNLKDITRWSSRITITDSVLNPGRTREEKILEAVKGLDVQMGNKFRIYPTNDQKLKTEDCWCGDHDCVQLSKRLYSTLDIFSNVIKMEAFPKYHLKNKKIKEALQLVINAV